jgi:quercetin dioxygenase-like cupin family protein
MNITRAKTVATKRGPAHYFTGAVWLDEVTPAPYASDVRVVVVTFEPGARTAWHTHPHGQLLQILSGVGRVQKAGEGITEVLPGDVIWFEPGERHWHGAAPDRMMSHLAVQRADEGGKTATWQEHVTDADYADGNQDRKGTRSS